MKPHYYNVIFAHSSNTVVEERVNGKTKAARIISLGFMLTVKAAEPLSS